MTDERLQEIREAVAKQRRFMERNCRGQYITKTHSVTHTEELIAEVERLRGELAEAGKDSADWGRLNWWIGSLERQKAHVFQQMSTKGWSFSQALDSVAGKEATWLPK